MEEKIYTKNEMLDIKHEAYQKGIKEKGHNKPSEETIKKFDSMSEEITNIKITLSEHGKDIAYIKQNSDEMKNSQEKFIEKLDDFINNSQKCYADKNFTETFIEEAPKKFASKLTEKVVYAFIGMVLTAFSIYIIKLVIPEKHVSDEELRQQVTNIIESYDWEIKK